jgi:hypothetical protein
MVLRQGRLGRGSSRIRGRPSCRNAVVVRCDATRRPGRSKSRMAKHRGDGASRAPFERREWSKGSVGLGLKTRLGRGCQRATVRLMLSRSLVRAGAVPRHLSTDKKSSAARAIEQRKQL